MWTLIHRGRYSHPGLNPEANPEVQFFHPNTKLFFILNQEETFFLILFFPITSKLRLFSDDFVFQT